MFRRLLCTGVAVAFLFTLPGCATTGATNEQQCRRMRGAAAGRGIGMAIGAVVVFGVVLVAAAGGGSPNFGGSGSSRRAEARQRRRAERIAACERAAGDSSAQQIAAANEPPPPPTVAQGPEAAMDIPLEPVEAGPPSFVELQQAIAPVLYAVRACAPMARGTLHLDARLDGATGRVVGVALGGPIAGQVSPQCAANAASRIQVRTFHGVVDVRWLVNFPQ